LSITAKDLSNVISKEKSLSEKNPMDEIIENLYLGDWEDALTVPEEYVRLCVLEAKPPGEPPGALWLPFLNGEKADKAQLDLIANTIDALLKDGKKVLLHCGAGIERSPLACVWFLHTKRNMDFDEAYEFVKEKRPIVADRRTWLGK